MRYTLANGSVRTTCGEHRRLGFAYAETTAGGLGLVCRSNGCSDGPSLHESSDETLERRDWMAAREAEGLTVAEAVARLARDGMPAHTCEDGPGSPILATNRGTCPACS